VRESKCRREVGRKESKVVCINWKNKTSREKPKPGWQTQAEGIRKTEQFPKYDCIKNMNCNHRTTDKGKQIQKTLSVPKGNLFAVLPAS